MFLFFFFIQNFLSFFHPSFCLIFLFSWSSSSSGTQFSLPSLSWFFWTTIRPPFVHPFVPLLSFFSLLVFSFFYHICFSFSFLFSLSVTSFKDKYLELLHFLTFYFLVGHFTNFFCFSFLSVFFLLTKNKVSFFVFYSLVFFNMILFCSLSWTSVSPLFLFYWPFWSFLVWRFSLIRLSFFCPFLFSHITYCNFFNINWCCEFFPFLFFFFFFEKETVFFMCFFQMEKYSVVFSLSSCFLFFRKTVFLLKKLCLLSLWLPVSSLHFSTENVFNIFPSKMSSLPLCSSLLFILYPLVVFFLSLRVFPFLSHFSPLWQIFLVFYCRIVFSIFIFLYCIYLCILVNVCKTIFLCFLFPPKNMFCLFPFFGWTFWHLFVQCFVFFQSLEKWFLAFFFFSKKKTLLSVFLFHSFFLKKILCLLFYSPVLLYQQICWFFSNKLGVHLPFFLFLFSCFFFKKKRKEEKTVLNHHF